MVWPAPVWPTIIPTVTRIPRMQALFYHQGVRGPKIPSIQAAVSVQTRKIPKPIKGLDGVYSLKRLSEAI